MFGQLSTAWKWTLGEPTIRNISWHTDGQHRSDQGLCCKFNTLKIFTDIILRLEFCTEFEDNYQKVESGFTPKVFLTLQVMDHSKGSG